MDNTYYNNKGKYQAEYTRLLALVSDSGACQTVAGEIIRACNRLGHDFYNNGMGNNTSGAANMLLELGVIDDSTHDTIYPFTRGRLYNGNYNGDRLQLAIEKTVDSAVKHILAHPELEAEANTSDMFDWAEDDEIFCDECGDSMDDTPWGGWGSTCRYCSEFLESQEEDEEE